MGRVQAKARPNITTTIGLRIRYTDWFLALRRVLFLLFLVDVVAVESQLSALVIKGDGADKVVASPSLVALLLFASLSAAALLRWDSISHGVLSAWQSLLYLPDTLREMPYSVRDALSRLLPRRSALHTLLDRWRVALRAATWRHWCAAALVWGALLSALVASALVSGPVEALAAQWFWIAGIVLLIIAALVWPAPPPLPLSRLRWRLAAATTSRDQPRWRARLEYLGRLAADRRTAGRGSGAAPAESGHDALCRPRRRGVVRAGGAALAPWRGAYPVCDGLVWAAGRWLWHPRAGDAFCRS